MDTLVYYSKMTELYYPIVVGIKLHFAISINESSYDQLGFIKTSVYSCWDEGTI